MANRLPLTQRQQQVLALIVERITVCGYPPTLREIGGHLHITSTNGVADHIKALKRKGYLKQQGQKSRTLQPIRPNRRMLAKTPVFTAKKHGAATGLAATDHAAAVQAAAERAAPRAALVKASCSTSHGQGPSVGTRRIPLLGRVAAGEPLLAVEQAEGEITVDAAWAGTAATVFGLTVVGDSMIEAGILQGDIVFVQRRDEANVGDIVIVLIDNEATMKRYYPEGERVRLQPANAAMKPIFLTEAHAQSISIVGIVIGVYRRL